MTSQVAARGRTRLRPRARLDRPAHVPSAEQPAVDLRWIHEAVDDAAEAEARRRVLATISAALESDHACYLSIGELARRSRLDRQCASITLLIMKRAGIISRNLQPDQRVATRIMAPSHG